MVAVQRFEMAGEDGFLPLDPGEEVLEIWRRMSITPPHHKSRFDLREADARGSLWGFAFVFGVDASEWRTCTSSVSKQVHLVSPISLLERHGGFCGPFGKAREPAAPLLGHGVRALDVSVDHGASCSCAWCEVRFAIVRLQKGHQSGCDNVFPACGTFGIVCCIAREDVNNKDGIMLFCIEWQFF